MVWAIPHKLLSAFLALIALSTPAAAERVPTSAPEFPRETEALVAATVSLFEAAEAKSASEPSANILTLVPVPTQISVVTDEDGLTAFDTDHGPVRHLTGYQITWYPVDTLLGAVDFMGTWNNARNLVCGYVTWDLSNPDAPEMKSLVANYVDVSDIAHADRATREAALLDANCAFGDIDANYTVLN